MKIRNFINKAILISTFALTASLAWSYGDGDDPDCPWGCLMPQTSTITEIRTYRNSNEMAVGIDTGIAECPEGGYIAPNAPNSAGMLSMLLSAFHANTQIKLQVYKNKEWSSTTGPTHCLIRAVRLYK